MSKKATRYSRVIARPAEQRAALSARELTTAHRYGIRHAARLGV